MHSNIITLALCVLAVPASVTARPHVHALSQRSVEPVARVAHPISLRRRNQRAQLQQVSCETAPAAEAGKEAAVVGKEKGAAAAEKNKEAAAGEKGAAAGEKNKEAAAGEKNKEAAAGEKNKEAAAGEGGAAAEEGAKANEVEIESAFDAAVPVQGGELKQDLVFTPSTVGKFEYEFQSAAADEITVTENVGAAAAAPPTGFEAIEPNSYTVALAVSKGAGLTLSKIDYIFDAAAAGLAGKDVTQAKVGKLCAETGSFVISETLGELEFEAEENEVTLNLNKNVTAEGQWGIFLPIAAAGAAEGAAGAAEKEKAALEAAQKEKAAAAEKEKAAAAEKEKAAMGAAEKEKAALEAAQKEKVAMEAAQKEKIAMEAAQKEKAAAPAAHEVAQQEKAAAEKVQQEKAAAEKVQQEKAAPAMPHEAAQAAPAAKEAQVMGQH